MDNINIQNEEEKLFEEWEKAQPCEKAFVRDGVVDEEVFVRQPCRFVFVLKEANQFGEAKEYEGSLAKFVKDGAPNNGGHTWNPVCKWLTGTDKVYNQAERRDVLKPIAVVNLKKEDGGNRTDMNALRDRVERDKEFLKRQLEIYVKREPVVFVCCGPWLLTMLKNSVQPLFKNHDSLEVSRNDSILYIKPYTTKKVYFVAFNHPNCRKASLTLINEFKKIKALFAV